MFGLTPEPGLGQVRSIEDPLPPEMERAAEALTTVPGLEGEFLELRQRWQELDRRWHRAGGLVSIDSRILEAGNQLRILAHDLRVAEENIGQINAEPVFQQARLPGSRLVIGVARWVAKTAGIAFVASAAAGTAVAASALFRGRDVAEQANRLITIVEDEQQPAAVRAAAAKAAQRPPLFNVDFGGVGTGALVALLGVVGLGLLLERRGGD